MDFGSSVGGAVAGNLATKFIGSAIMAAFIPEAAVGAVGFAAEIFIGVKIEQYVNKMKDYYYGR